MAIPSTTYDIATATNPSSALTDFTFIVDLSNMSSAWWAAVNTTDGTKGRASKSDGTTELACDWIDFDSTAETGILRVKYTGTLASTGTQQIRVYPPISTNTSYGVSDTYGQYNAYNSDFVYYSPNGEGENDRTSNQISGAYIGSPVIDSEIGLVGKSTLYDGITAYWQTLDSNMLETSDMSMGMVFKLASGTPYSLGDTVSKSMLRPYNGTMRYYHNNVSFPNASYLTNIYNYTYVSVDSLGNAKTSVNDISEYSTTMNPSDIMDNFNIGYHYSTSPIYIQHVFKMSTNISDSWRLEEYSQLSDQSTFWGTWTNVPVGGEGVELSPLFTGTGDILTSLTLHESVFISGIFEGEGTILTTISVDELINISPIFDSTGEIISPLTISEEILLSPIFTGTGDILTAISIAGEIQLSANVDGVGDINTTLTIIEDNPVLLSANIDGVGDVICYISILPVPTISGRINISMKMKNQDIKMTIKEQNITMNIKSQKITMKME